MVTFLGLGVCALFGSELSARIGTTAEVLGGISMYECIAVVVVVGTALRITLVLVIDCSPPCIGQAEARAKEADLPTPGISLENSCQWLNTIEQ